MKPPSTLSPSSPGATGAPVGPTGARPPVRGFAIVELMIALVLGLIIVAAMGQLYSGSSQAYLMSDAIARLNENGRFAVDFISNDLRMAGYISCGGTPGGGRMHGLVGNSVDGGGSWLYKIEGIEGFEGGIDTPPSEFTGRYRLGTDVLITRRAATDLERALLADDSSNAIMQLGFDHGFEVGEILAISDPSCRQTSVFQVTGLRNVEHPEDTNTFDSVIHAAADANHSPGNCTARLRGQFSCADARVAETGGFRPGSTVSRYAVNAYYITAGEPPTLARIRLTHANGNAIASPPEELIRDVEDLQVLYGRNTVVNAVETVSYTTADRISDWTTVVSVRFALVMRSREPNVLTAASNVPIEVLETSFTPADRRLHKVFGSVVAIRNHLQ